MRAYLCLMLTAAVGILLDDLGFALDPPIQDAPDVCITCQGSPTLAQSEPSVAIKPTDPRVVLMTCNTWTTSAYTNLIGADASISTDGGTTWAVEQTGTGGLNGGDPACGIGGPTGRFFSDYIRTGPLEGQDVAYKDSPAGTWTVVEARRDPGDFLDRGHLWVDNDNTTGNIFYGRVYVGWTAILSGNTVEAVNSSDGTSYVNRRTISNAGASEMDWGVNFHTGPGPLSGEFYVYASWTVSNLNQDEKDLGFARSKDGGFLWDPSAQVPIRIDFVGSPPVPLHLRGTATTRLADQAKYPQAPPCLERPPFSTPSLAVDRNTKHIYLVWTNRGDPLSATAGTNDRNIYVIKSTNHGVTWSLPAGLLPSGAAKPVNQDPPSTPVADQWFPRIVWDEATGSLIVLYYDSRNHNYTTGDNTADVYVSVSRDGGVTWEDFQVSDGSGVYQPTFCDPGNDYIGLAASHGRAYAVWADDRSTRTHLRVHSSRILLWGIQQSSVAATSVPIAGNQIRVTATWNTNMAAAAGDQLTLVSPNQLQYTSPTCTTCSPGGLSHTLVFDVPCEPGLWSFTVKSNEQFGTERQSSPATFFVAPTVLPPSGTIVSNYPGVASYTCPRGEGVSRFVASVDFEGTCVSQVNANRLALQALPMDVPSRKMAFFPQTVPQPADGSATVSNGYATTITERQVGGCNGGPAALYLDGVAIGSVNVPSTPSVDLNGSGIVDAADLALFGATMGYCAPSYDSCANFVSLNNCVDSSDYGNFGAHYGHRWDVTSKVATGVAAVTRLAIDPNAPSGTAAVEVRLEGLQDRSAFGVVLRPASGKLQFAEWTPKPEHAATAIAVAGVDELGPRLALLDFDVTPDASGIVELGRLTFLASDGGATADDLVVTYEDVASYAAAIESAGRDAPLTTSLRTELIQNVPNPFNPMTTIRYTVARDSDVRLMVFNVAGRLVRTLVEKHQASGEYTIVWDGRDESGLEVASGIYVYRLATGDFTDTKKLVLLR